MWAWFKTRLICFYSFRCRCLAAGRILNSSIPLLPLYCSDAAEGVCMYSAASKPKARTTDSVCLYECLPVTKGTRGIMFKFDLCCLVFLRSCRGIDTIYVRRAFKGWVGRKIRLFSFSSLFAYFESFLFSFLSEKEELGRKWKKKIANSLTRDDLQKVFGPREKSVTFRVSIGQLATLLHLTS